MAETPPQKPPPKPRAIDRVRTNFFASRQRLEIPEWADDEGRPMEAFFTPLTGHDIAQLNARDPKGDAEYLVSVLVLKLMDDAGQPLFSWGDVQALLSEAHYTVVYRIAQAVQTRFTVPLATLDDAKKNSVTTTPSGSSAGSDPSMDGALPT